MVVIAHQDPGMQYPALRLAAQVQTFQEALTRTGGFKNEGENTGVSPSIHDFR